MSSKKISLIFWILVAADLVAILLHLPWLIYIAKPLLMPALALRLVKTSNSKGRNIILTGLFFSWLGDIFLLQDANASSFFMAGLGSFLLTHCCYIFYFLSERSPGVSLLKKRPLYILPVAGYGVALVYLLLPYLGPLKVPVIIYAIVICTMLLCSIHIYRKLAAPANRYFFAGAGLFLLSDSTLAIDKFHHPLPLGGCWIMLTYCTAQYLIVSGCINVCKASYTRSDISIR